MKIGILKFLFVALFLGCQVTTEKNATSAEKSGVQREELTTKIGTASDNEQVRVSPTFKIMTLLDIARDTDYFG